MKVTKQTNLGQLLKQAPGAAAFLQSAGLHCVGCPSAQGESIEEACRVHGLDAEVMVKNLNAYLLLAPHL